MSTIRSANLYVTPQLNGWLRWVAAIDESTADALAEKLLRESLLGRYPNLVEVEAEFSAKRGKLNDEAVEKLKANEPNA